MRLLIYAMESSGASTFCYFLGQRPGSVAIVDLWSRYIAPALRLEVPIVAKATTTMRFRAIDHIASFEPDKIIVFVRDPVAVYKSLSQYPYGNNFGRVVEKLGRFDEEFEELMADLILRYEDFTRKSDNLMRSICDLGWPCSPSYYDLKRSLTDILHFNSASSVWLEQHFDKGWGFGNIKGDAIVAPAEQQPHSPLVVQTVSRISPRLMRYYGYLEGEQQ